jgi:NAD-dependent SIR2 family protein deacetylase
MPVLVQYEAESRRQSLYSLLKECSPAHVRPEELPSSKLAAYNSAMAQRRVAARQADRNLFLDFLVRIFKEDRLMTCMTTSFDGLEARSCDGHSDKVVMLYGDNRILRCCTRMCQFMSEEETKSLDEEMCSTGLVLCKGCTQKSAYTAAFHAPFTR